MSTKPILFNTEMVRAILDGRKSCTRRICKDANECTVPDMDYYDPDKRTYAVHNYADKKHTDKLSIAERTCPICPGDILYVRETWHKGLERYIYRANYSDTEKFYRDGKEIEMKWHPSIHMPKEATRIWLKVTDVRVERLQDITSKQICKEGIEVEEPYVLNGEEKRYAFSRLWDSTVKKSDLDRYGWNANPWVWVIEFERCERGGIDG
nr:MAG TPA: ASCH domain protein [Caudoviricetes sp.]